MIWQKYDEPLNPMTLLLKPGRIVVPTGYEMVSSSQKSFHTSFDEIEGGCSGMIRAGSDDY